MLDADIELNSLFNLPGAAITASMVATLSNDSRRFLIESVTLSLSESSDKTSELDVSPCPDTTPPALTLLRDV